MSKEDSIPYFEKSNDLHERTGYDHRTHIPGFDAFTLESLEPTCRRCMPPYRQGFFQIGILSNTGSSSSIDINTNAVSLEGLPLWFVVPGQVFSWVRDPSAKGYHIQFNLEFLPNTFSDFYEEFPFLKLTENNVFLTSKEEHQAIQSEMSTMLQVFQDQQPYHEQRLKGMLVSLLYNCKAVYDRHTSKEEGKPTSQILTQRFQQLVDRIYLETKNVGEYADHLNVTPNYLTTIVKETTGKTAKDIIQDRIFLESKNLLAYTDMDISRIAYTLNFSEPTHFTRFFKKYSGETPNKYRAVH
ncbi:MAG: helix-turn-helix domain-containing protein [Bacteroidota bacterium]